MKKRFSKAAGGDGDFDILLAREVEASLNVFRNLQYNREDDDKNFYSSKKHCEHSQEYFSSSTYIDKAIFLL